MGHKENNSSKESAKEIKGSLSDLLDGDEIPPEPSNMPVANNNDEFPEFNSHEAIDLPSVSIKAESTAKKLMNSLLKIYLSSDIINNNEYVKAKSSLDKMTLKILIGQIQKTEHALDTMISNIDLGEMHPRMFEVYGGLQKTLLELLKHQTLHLHAMEESTKKIKSDIDLYSDMKPVESKKSSSNNGKTNRGTRSIMMDLQSDIESERNKTEDIDFEESN